MSPRTATVLRIALCALLLVWGSYTLFIYLGVPVHQEVLMTAEDRTAVQNACPDLGEEGTPYARYFCMGWRALMPVVLHTAGRMAPLGVYAVLGILGLAGLFVAQYLRTGEWRLRLRLAPWMPLVGFFAALWLLFTTIGMPGATVDSSYRRVIEPIPEIYVGTNPEGLEALQENFRELQDRGCLTEIGTLTNGARAYQYGMGCMQASFFTRVLPLAAAILFLLFDLLVLGRLLLSLLRARPEQPLLEATLSLGIGACGMLFLLWLLAVLHIYFGFVGWILMLGIPVVGWRHAAHWLRALRRTWDTDAGYGLRVVLAWLLLSFLAFNFLHVVRPFPIGWDDLGRYLNQPRLLVSYGHIIPSLSSFQWEYVTSLGFLLFGYDSTFAATLSMLINWSAALLALAAVFAFGNAFLGKGRGLLAALFYYSLPMVGHFSFADMKVDNAVFAMGALCTLCAFLYACPMAEEGEDPAPDWRWLVLAGITGGIAFSLKPTSVMAIVGSLPVMVAAAAGWLGFLAAFLGGWALYAFEGRLNPPDLLQRIGGNPDLLDRHTLLLILVLLACTAAGYAGWMHRRRALGALRAIGIFLATCIVAVLPWLLYNNILYGHVVPQLLLTSPNSLTPTFAMSGEEVVDFGQPIRTLPEELQIDPNNAACKSTSKAEELDRYWGYRTDWSHYLTLPWRAVMNIDSAGYYVTLLPSLLLFPLLLLLPFAWTRKGRWLLYLAGSTAFVTMQWTLFANGIPWYGLSMFLGLCVGMEALAVRPPNDPEDDTEGLLSILSRWTAGILVGLSVIIGFGMRMWQFEQQNDLLKYPFGVESAQAMRLRVIPEYDIVRDIVMDRYETMEDRPYVYRVGTFIPYFIPRNLEVIPVADHQLDQFNCMYQESDPALTVRRLKALGFNSIIFDTNTQTIEQDPNGSLHKKVQRFVDFLNDPRSGLQVKIYNPNAGLAFVLIP